MSKDPKENQNKGPAPKSNPKSNKRGRGKRGNSSSGIDRDDSKVRSKDFGSKGCNDISWYAQDTTLLRNVANFPWSNQSGLSYDDNHSMWDSGNVTQTGNIKFTAPGIMAFHVLPGLGNTKYELDAVNVAANAMYVFIRHMNSGAKNYDAPDLMNYILAMDEVFTFISFCQRLYGTLGMYNVYNRYMPDALIRMQGVDPDDLRENMVQFRYRLNTIIKQAATLVVPATFPVFERHSFLFRDYYIEGTDMKDQVYMYTPVNFRKFNIPSGGGPGELVYEPIITRGGNYYRLNGNASVLATGNELLDYLQDMVQRIYLDEDFGIMAGDILKAYGEGKVIRLSELPDAYVCTLKSNNEVLLQMKNCNVADGVWTYFSTGRPGIDAFSPNFGEIHQDPNTNRIYENLTALLTSVSPLEIYDMDHHMLTLEGDPSPEMNMIMSRLVHDYDVNPGLATVKYTCGTELVVHVSVCIDVDPFSVWEVNTKRIVGPVVASVLSGAVEVGALSAFKYHPCVFFLACSSVPISSLSDIDGAPRVFQVDNFTIVSGDILDRLNQVAIMSEFNVPHMALT